MDDVYTSGKIRTGRNTESIFVITKCSDSSWWGNCSPIKETTKTLSAFKLLSGTVMCFNHEGIREAEEERIKGNKRGHRCEIFRTISQLSCNVFQHGQSGERRRGIKVVIVRHVQVSAWKEKKSTNWDETLELCVQLVNWISSGRPCSQIYSPLLSLMFIKLESQSSNPLMSRWRTREEGSHCVRVKTPEIWCSPHTRLLSACRHKHCI